VLSPSADLPALCPAADDRRGVLTVDGVQHEVLLQDLPTVVESYKTLDDANLVKVTDIGQVCAGPREVCGPAGATCLGHCWHACLTRAIIRQLWHSGNLPAALRGALHCSADADMSSPAKGHQGC
jgi:hypothetical protein